MHVYEEYKGHVVIWLYKSFYMHEELLKILCAGGHECLKGGMSILWGPHHEYLFCVFPVFNNSRPEISVQYSGWRLHFLNKCNNNII